MADAVNEVGPGRLLDLYAYAGGRPDDYFDPNGAARIRYFAITTGANGHAIGTTSGFTQARWAFIVDQVQAPSGSSSVGGDNALSQLQQRYASNGEGLLVDVGGDFLAGGTSNAIWQSGASTPDDFTQHYGSNLISIAQFTIETMSDTDATKLIASYIAADQQQLGSCVNKQALMPAIPFSPGEAALNPTNSTMPQRILNCGNADLTSSSADAIKARLLVKLNEALSLNETLSIYKPCGAGGCPSAGGIYLNGITDGRPTRTNVPAAYSYLQFAPETLSEIVLEDILRPSRPAQFGITNDDLASVDLDNNATAASVTQAATRSRWVYVYGDCMQGRDSRYRNNQVTPMPCPSAATLQNDWRALTVTEQNDFQTKTGLGETAWSFMRKMTAGTLVSGTDYVRGTNPKELLDGLAWAAWQTNTEATDWILGLSGSTTPTGRFNTLALDYLKIRYSQVVQRMGYGDATVNPLANGGTEVQQEAIDVELAARIVRRHNGGAFTAPISSMKASDPNNYVKKIYGDSLYASYGNYPSMHCASDSQLFSRNGLLMTSLSIP